MAVTNLSAAIPYSDGTTYPNGTLGKRIQDLLADVISVSVPDGSITEAKLATDSVSTGKILALNVTTAKIANDAVTYAKLQNVSATKRICAARTRSVSMSPTTPIIGGASSMFA